MGAGGTWLLGVWGWLGHGASAANNGRGQAEALRCWIDPGGRRLLVLGRRAMANYWPTGLIPRPQDMVLDDVGTNRLLRLNGWY